MPTFSQRHGHEPIEMPFQRGGVDEALRTKLWNVLAIGIWDHWQAVSEWHNRSSESEQIEGLVKRLWIHFFNYDLDKLPEFKEQYGRKGSYEVLKTFFFECAWHQLYSFLEELADDRSRLFSDQLRRFVNDELERHNAAYRFVGKQIAEITSEHEIAAIEEAQRAAANPVREHLQTALRMLRDREKPDYRNSIKESISAVEAACRAATGMPKATLGDALKRIPNLHQALAKGFDKIYGYTSDANGIRHSLTDEAADNTYAEAKFMLVACSGFVSYLKATAK